VNKTSPQYYYVVHNEPLGFGNIVGALVGSSLVCYYKFDCWHKVLTCTTICGTYSGDGVAGLAGSDGSVSSVGSVGRK
jgi:hypothetical protein